MSMHDPLVYAETQIEAVGSGPVGDALEPGSHVGAHIITRLIGEGGMGRVYLAQQTAPVRREVALKLIREQFASPLALAYFEVERQALAQMRHPGIAQIFDAGTTTDGQPWLAMELVEGEPITQFCREHQLDCDKRLTLFARVCHAVQHAHQKGVIHRDLKPANVLVRLTDGAPAPKIIDFGIAIGGAGSHATGVQNVERAGTAIYMSPEQAGDDGRGGIDTRSDVYSLGVMLFEILTGSEAASLTSGHYRSRAAGRNPLHDTLLAAERMQDAPATKELVAAARRLPVELRAVLRRALAHDRTDRYESADALAEDLQRYRENRPLRAMPASRSYAARKFMARHRLGITASVLVAAALVAGAALALVGQSRAERAAALAQVEARKAQRISGFVTDMLAGIDPDRARGMDRSLMRMVLDSAAERAGTELADQPEVRSAIERTIAQSYSGIGEYVQAEQHFVGALDAARRAGAPPVEQAKLLMSQAQVAGNRGQYEAALVTGQQALDLVADLAPTDRVRLRLGGQFGWLERGAGNYEASRLRLETILDLQRRTFGADDADTLDSQRALAATYTRLDRFAEATPLLEDTLARYRAVYGDDSIKTIDVTTGLAVALLEQEHYAEAEALLKPVLPVTEKVLGPDHPNTMILVSNLGGAIRNQDRNEEARPYYERVVATNVRLHGPDYYLSVSGHSNLARLLRDLGDISGAERHAREATAHMDAAFGPDNPTRAIFIEALVSVLIAAHKYDEAERELDRAYALLSVHPGFGPNHSRTQDLVRRYVELYTGWHKPERAAKWQARLVVAPSDS